MKPILLITILTFSTIFVLSEQGKRFFLSLLPEPATRYQLEHSYYGEEFNKEFFAVCERLDIAPAWLEAVILFESNWNARACNPQSGAFGLIQFLPQTLANLGSSVDELKRSSPMRQLQLIEAYYVPAKWDIKSELDLRLYTFYPAAIGQPDSYIIGDSAVAKRNFIYDLNHDEKITVGEFKRAVLCRN